MSFRKTTLETVLARWRARLPPGTSPAALDAFVQRNRPALEDRVARKAATHGELPETAREFAAYDLLVARERTRDAEPDERVWQRLAAQIDRRIRRGAREIEVLANFGLDYVNARGEALLLRGAGWDALALLLARPALAILAGGSVVAVRDTFGRLAIHPDRRGKLNHLHADLDRVEREVLRLREVLGIPLGTKARLGRFALELWARARAATAGGPR